MRSGAFLAGVLGALQQGEAGGQPGERPRTEVPWTAAAPAIDGVLEESVWSAAARLGALTQVEPLEGAAAVPPTEVLLLRDATHLYLGFVCHEPTPGAMVLQNMSRDAFLNDDDRLELILDTFRDGRTGYFFQVSAAGSRGDALIGADGNSFNKRWDGFWEARTSIGPDRWVAELAIPFQTLAAGPGAIWRFNVERYRGADRSRSRWASPRRDLRVMMPSAAGEIGGMDAAASGFGMELVPYFKLRRSELENPESKTLAGTGGGDFGWRITPQLRGSLTWNTDFAETEADQRRVNLTRFPLFFPEKRDFFLEDANLFEFGQQNSPRGGTDALPYFSRRIGLTRAGEEVPIAAGVRLAGRVEDLDLGLLAVQTGEGPGGVTPAADLFVMRPALRIGEELAAGALFTSGNPEAAARNEVAGADLRFQRTDFLPGYRLNSNVWVARSSDQASHAIGSAWGASAALVSRDWSHSFDTFATQSSFEPALGFVRRPGERYYQLETRWEPRPGGDSGVREYRYSFRPRWWTDAAGAVQTHGIDLGLFGVEWHSGDRFSATWAFDGDRLDAAFTPARGVSIRQGFHHWHALEAEFQSSPARPFAVGLDLGAGQWYDGQAVQAAGTLDWRPGGRLWLGVEIEENHFWTPGGDFVTRLGIARADLAFSPDLSWQNLVQADDQSDLVGAQSRLRWLLEDGRELFLVANYAWQELPDGPFVPVDRDTTLKLVYSLRF